MMNLLSRPATGILFAALFATTTTAQVDLDFKGGSIKDYVQVARKAIEAQSKYERPNILLKGPAAEVMLPSLKLGSVHPMDALQVLERYESPDHSINVSRLHHGNDSSVRPVMVVEIEPRRKRAPKSNTPEPTATHVMSVRDLVEIPLNLRESDDAASLVVPIETLLSALDVAFSLQKGDAPTIKFHPESSLLFVRGSGTQINVADDVILKLQRPIEANRSIALGQLADKRRKEAQKPQNPSGR